MAKIPGTSISDVVKPYRVRQGTGALYVADAVDYDPVWGDTNHGMPSSLAPVGLTDGAISINPNVDTADITSDQMYTTFDSPITGYNFTIELSLDQSDVYNIQLGLALLDDAIDNAGNWIASSTTMMLGGENPSGTEVYDSDFYAVQIKSSAPRKAGSSSQVAQVFNFWKCKIFFNGAFDISKTAKTTLPLQIRAFGNSADGIGFMEVKQLVTAPSPAWGVH